MQTNKNVMVWQGCIFREMYDMSAGSTSEFALIEEIKSLFEGGWTVEIKCTKSAEQSYAGFKGRWTLRCISQDGRSKMLATFRDPDKPRQIKNLAGVYNLVRKELGSDYCGVSYEAETTARFNKRGLVP